jgi:serine/threonine protein kinase
MCELPESEIISTVRAAVAASQAPLTTQMIGDMMAARGLCRYHVLDALRVAHRKGRLRTRDASQNANPFTFPGALWTVPETSPPEKAEVLDPGRFAIPLPRKILGRGGNGIVVLGLQLSIDRPCAIKLLDPELLKNAHGEPVQAKRFDREVRYLARLSHPNIITVYDGGRSPSTGAAYLAMELMEWPTLQQLLAERGALPPLLVAKVIRAVALGLQYAHERARIFHRDVKPANVFVSVDLATAKVADFGLACLDDADLDVPARDTAITRAGPGLLGSPETAAPERYMAAKGDFRSDFYSLGMTMYLAITGGVSPFPGIVRGQSQILEWVNAHQNVDTTALDILHTKRCPDCPERLAQLLRRMIRREPSERPQSYAEVLSGLDRAIRDLEPAGSKSRPALAKPSEETSELAAALQGERFEAAHEVPTVLDPSLTRLAPIVLPTIDSFQALLDRMTALENRAEKEHGPDALYIADQPLLQRLAARALDRELLPTLREIFEADARKKCPEFDRTYARLAAGEKLPPGTPDVPLPLTRYFYDAVALSTFDDRLTARAKELAERVLVFLEEALEASDAGAKSRQDKAAGSTSSPPESPAGATPSTGQARTSVTGVAPADLFAPGSQIGALRIVRELGRGGMATVYLAHDQDLDRPVAVKVLNPSSDPAIEEENKRRFSREFKFAANLKHPNIVPIHATFVHEGRQCLVMDLVDGTSLATVIRVATRIEPIRALKIVRQIADGLGYAHKRDIVHRDVKPDNILVDVIDRAILIDFGLTKSVRMEFGGRRGTATVQGTFLGTPHYTSPEQASGQPVDQRGDIYSLGATLYEMLTGARPFTAPTELAVLHAIADLKALPEPLSRRVPGTDPELEVLVDRMMAKRPEERFVSCDDVVAAIDRLISRMEHRAAKRSGRRAMAAGILVAVTIAGVVAYSAWPRRSAEQNAAEESPKGSFLLPHDERKNSEPSSEPDKTPSNVNAAVNDVKVTPKTPTVEPASPQAPAKSVPPPYVPTEAELRFLAHVLETVRNSFGERSGYSFSKAVSDLDIVERSPENTAWTATYVRAESDRLKGAGHLVASRPLFPAEKEVHIILRDGKTIRGRVTFEDAARITLLLPSGLFKGIALSDIAPTTLSDSYEDPWNAFALRASAGDAAGALAIYAAAPEALRLRIEQGHLPGLVDEAIEEALAAAARGSLSVLSALKIPDECRKALPRFLNERLARFDTEARAAELYRQKETKEALAALLTAERTTFAGLAAAREILEDFRRALGTDNDRELVDTVLWPSWAPDTAAAPEAKLELDQEAKTYVLTAREADHRALLKKRHAGSRDGYEVRYRAAGGEPTGIVGLSFTRWLEIQGPEVRFYKTGEKSPTLAGHATLPVPAARALVTVCPVPLAGLVLVYVDGRLVFALEQEPELLGGGLLIGVKGGTIVLESVRVKNSKLDD